MRVPKGLASSVAVPGVQHINHIPVSDSEPVHLRLEAAHDLLFP